MAPQIRLAAHRADLQYGKGLVLEQGIGEVRTLVCKLGWSPLRIRGAGDKVLAVLLGSQGGKQGAIALEVLSVFARPNQILIPTVKRRPCCTLMVYSSYSEGLIYRQKIPWLPLR